MATTDKNNQNGYTTFRSSDGILFLFSLPLLARHSSFFEALNALPPSDEVVDLDISAHALQGIFERLPRFSTLTPAEKEGRPIPDHFRYEIVPDNLLKASVISEILLVTHKYDLFCLTRILFEEVEKNPKKTEPDVLYVLAAIEGKDTEVSTWRQLFKCTGSDKGVLDAKAVLERFELSAKYDILEKVVLDWRKDHSHMRMDFQAEAIKWRLHVQYSRGLKDGMGHTCDLTGDDFSFNKYLAFCERYTSDYLSSGAAALPNVMVRPVTLREMGVKCNVCIDRLEEIMDSLWLSYCNNEKRQYVPAQKEAGGDDKKEASGENKRTAAFTPTSRSTEYRPCYACTEYGPAVKSNPYRDW